MLRPCVFRPGEAKIHIMVSCINLGGAMQAKTTEKWMSDASDDANRSGRASQGGIGVLPFGRERILASSRTVRVRLAGAVGLRCARSSGTRDEPDSKLGTLH